MLKFTMHNRFLLIIMLLVQSALAYTQNTDSVPARLPDVAVTTLDYRTIHSSTLLKSGQPVVLIFWRSCCLPNINMLDAISEVYGDWQKETGVVIYAVATDDSRSSAGIGPMAHGKGWEFIILLDLNADFKRAMNVNETPHIFLFDKEKKLRWQKASYIEGDENEIFKILKAL